MSSVEEKYKLAERKRQKYVDRVLSSSESKKIVVAGPGTGKTHLFQEILKGKKNALTLTFINALVDDLALDLAGLSKVRTLHGYARGVLKDLYKEVKIFHKFPKVISEDIKVIEGKTINFDNIFYELDRRNKDIAFYNKQRDYYKGFFGHPDVIYAAVEYLEKNPRNIKKYDILLVDEFQDFNLSEVALIDLLSSKSPVLVAGDDDQALYDFKKARNEYIRSRHQDKAAGYKEFELPYCSRCPRVVIEVTNEIVKKAEGKNLLKDRIPKQYLYFESEEKNRVSAMYPQISYKANLFNNSIARFIYDQLPKIAEIERSKFTVLVISPLPKHVLQISNYLKKKGLKNVTISPVYEKELTLLDGLQLLITDEKCNLGWRIAAQILMSAASFQKALRFSNSTKKPFIELVSDDCKKEVNELLKFIKLANRNRAHEQVDLADRLAVIGLDISSLIREHTQKSIFVKGAEAPRSIRNVAIKATTIPSSKGLSADYVFITHFDDTFFKGTTLTDQRIYNFLVALTRARKKVFLISSQPGRPELLTWINNKSIKNL